MAGRKREPKLDHANPPKALSDAMSSQSDADLVENLADATPADYPHEPVHCIHGKEIIANTVTCGKCERERLAECTCGADRTGPSAEAHDNDCPLSRTIPIGVDHDPDYDNGVLKSEYEREQAMLDRIATDSGYDPTKDPFDERCDQETHDKYITDLDAIETELHPHVNVPEAKTEMHPDDGAFKDGRKVVVSLDGGDGTLIPEEEKNLSGFHAVPNPPNATYEGIPAPHLLKANEAPPTIEMMVESLRKETQRELDWTNKEADRLAKELGDALTRKAYLVQVMHRNTTIEYHTAHLPPPKPPLSTKSEVMRAFGLDGSGNPLPDSPDSAFLPPIPSDNPPPPAPKKRRAGKGASKPRKPKEDASESKGKVQSLRGRIILALARENKAKTVREITHLVFSHPDSQGGVLPYELIAVRNILERNPDIFIKTRTSTGVQYRYHKSR